MAKRGRMHRGYSERNFTRNAQRIHRKNGLTGVGNPMRGGIRL